MSGIQWRTAIDETSLDAAPSAFAPEELPAAEVDLAAAAALRLGWHGSVLAPMTLLGRHIIAVAELNTATHAERLSQRAEPALDRAEVATWLWPEFADSAPAPAVELVGVLGVARHWRTALASAAPFANYCDVGIVLPWSAAMTSDYLVQCLPRAQRFGVSVLTADPDGQVNLDQCGRQEPNCVPESVINRWINEQVYHHMLGSMAELVG
ncbi:MAG: hypothetical protein ACRDRL_10875 [Sciscionella sp.]